MEKARNRITAISKTRHYIWHKKKNALIHWHNQTLKIRNFEFKIDPLKFGAFEFEESWFILKLLNKISSETMECQMWVHICLHKLSKL